MDVSTEGPTSSMQPDTSRLDQLQSSLKVAYRRLYKAVQPISSALDKLCCVNEVFVDGCIEVKNVPDISVEQDDFPPNCNQSQNKPIKSYRDIFDDNIVSSKRVVIEGESGYGKTMIALKAAYDWGEDASPLSPLKEVELLFLLPLRLLKATTSIYEAMKLFVLPPECTLAIFDIKQIMDSCTKIVIILDGYDEYSDLNNNLNSDVAEILKGTMFSNHKTILCTCPGCLPAYPDPRRTVRVRLTGFDASAHERYINMTPDGDARLAKVNKIMQIMKLNKVLCDILQNPYFFSMFVHMVDDMTVIDTCNSITRFFDYLVQSLNRKMRRKNDKTDEVSVDKSRLCKLALNGLVGKKESMRWEKEYFCQKVGKTCFTELIQLGILVEEVWLDPRPEVATSLPAFRGVVKRNHVRFKHKIFAEWYAAHHLCRRSGTLFEFSLRRILRKVKPIRLQFLFRFASGLRPSSAKSIIKHLLGNAGGDSCAIMCFWEQTSGNMDILPTIRDMCSRVISFETGDSRLFQRSRIKLSKTAVENRIPITKIRIGNCFHSIGLGQDSLCLSSGLQLPRLDSLTELEIHSYSNIDLRGKATGILTFAAKCTRLQKLIFSSHSIILLPQSISDKDVLVMLHRTNRIVEWVYRFRFLKYTRKLNNLSGSWEDDYLDEMPYSHFRQLVMKVQPAIPAVLSDNR